MWWSMWVACAGSDPGPDGLFGTRPLTDKAAPTFRATADSGEARDRDDLIGQATAMWFYPAAFTGG
ncbi:MAG: hypothetical protein ABMB14_07510 [Myxococcota bacterium]